MSRALPQHHGRERPANLAVLLREAFVVLNDRVVQRLAEEGHPELRPAHSAVFQHLDDTGTTVSRLAERARMTKQAMAELVAHLERHGYVERRPDPGDRRAKLVVPTARGLAVVDLAQSLVPEIEGLVRDALGARGSAALRADLEAVVRVASVGQEAAVNPPAPPPSPAPGSPRRPPAPPRRR